MPMNPRSRLSKRQSNSFIRQQRDRTIWKVGLSIVAVLAWLFVLSRLSWLGVFSIYNVEVYGADPAIALSLRDAALNQLDGAYVGLFSRSDTFLYPKSAIQHAVMNASARVDSVDVRRAGFHGLAINVTEKVPAAIVCSELPDFSSDPTGNDAASSTTATADSGCYYADDSGFIFEPAPSFSSQVYRRYYEPDLDDASSGSAAVGMYATSTEKFRELQAFFTGAHDSGIRTRGILMKDGGEYELYAENPSLSDQASAAAHSDIAVIYFNDGGSLPTELSNLISFWTKQLADARTSGKSPHFDSIDVRYGSNVFYRLEK